MFGYMCVCAAPSQKNAHNKTKTTLSPLRRCGVVWCGAVRCGAVWFCSCFVLFCCVLFCSVLCCPVLCCSVLFCSVLFCFVLFCFAFVIMVRGAGNTALFELKQSRQIPWKLGFAPRGPCRRYYR
eukprot:COSAG06_NODE_2256_length_7222_cov_14.605363_7_plen_125_part_00